jgi:cysteinyl-tRNA synthetase
MVRYWLHNGLMRASTEAGKVGGRSERDAGTEPNAGAEPATVTDAVSGKISRSKGAGGLASLIARHTGERIRFFLLRSHYRSTTIFGDEPLLEAGTALEAFYRLFDRFQRITGKSVYDLPFASRRSDFTTPSIPNPLVSELLPLRESFLSKMDDDFNTGGATADLFEMARAINRFIDGQSLEENKSPVGIEALQQGMQILREMAALLGIFLKPVPKSSSDDSSGKLVGELMGLIIKLRADARVRKDFATSDAVRDGLQAIGVAIQDGKSGTTWQVKS